MLSRATHQCFGFTPTLIQSCQRLLCGFPISLPTAGPGAPAPPLYAGGLPTSPIAPVSLDPFVGSGTTSLDSWPSSTPPTGSTSTSLPVKWLLSSQSLVVHSDPVKEAHEGDEKHSTADTDADASSSGETVTVADHDFKTPVDDIQQEVTASLRNIGREAPELRCYQLKHELLTIQLNGKGTDLTEDAEENFEDLRCYSHNERVVLSTSEETWVECGLVLAEKAAINMIYPLHIMLSLNALQCADIDSTFQV